MVCTKRLAQTRCCVVRSFGFANFWTPRSFDLSGSFARASFWYFCLCSFPDHWVSNVIDREQYLSTLNDVLGFEPKVNFNAGVVAAGEAIIESTVTGNTPTTRLDDAQVRTSSVLIGTAHIFSFSRRAIALN